MAVVVIICNVLYVLPVGMWLCDRNQREALSSERQQLEMNNQELHSLMEALHDSVTARQRHDNKAQLTQAVTDVLERHERHRDVMVKKSGRAEATRRKPPSRARTKSYADNHGKRRKTF